ncbi:MAG: glycosyltransferase [Candidatus Zixiibacteriota bacterium]
MSYDTALRGPVAERIGEIAGADIVVGIPCYNSERTIGHVIEMVSQGLWHHYSERDAVILVADGGSTDDTRETAARVPLEPRQERLVSIYRGIGGKGTALRSIFEAGERLGARACMVVDSDLRSITGDWVRRLLEPVLNDGYDFVAPIYTRHKYDGTITNNIVYNLTRALYGRRIRQPIGGDFAFSRACSGYFMRQQIWDTDIARFGIDIWMTTGALITGARVCQARLGVKVHDAKDPAAHLGPMFRQVLYTLFSLMEENELYWKTVVGSEPTEVFGEDDGAQPEPVAVNHAALCRTFRDGHRRFGVLWQQIFSPSVYAGIEQAALMPDDRLRIDIDIWVRLLYELAVTFHLWRSHRYKLLELSTPLYLARVASFINDTRNADSAEAEQLVEEQAQAFEDRKMILIDLWDGSALQPPALSEGLTSL